MNNELAAFLTGFFLCACLANADDYDPAAEKRLSFSTAGLLVTVALWIFT